MSAHQKAELPVYRQPASLAWRSLVDELQQSLTSRRLEFLQVDRTIVVRVCCFKRAFDHGCIFLGVECAVAVRVGGLETWLVEPAGKFLGVERAILVRIKSLEQLGSACLGLGEIDRAIVVGVECLEACCAVPPSRSRAS